MAPPPPRAARARWRSTFAARQGGGYDFEPVIVESYGRLGEPAFELLARLARVAAESGKVDEGKFIENTLKKMSVALCRGNGSILAAGQKALAQVTGHDVQPGLPRPPC